MKKTNAIGVLTILALIVVVTLGWCHSRDRFPLANWGVPIDYAGDAPQIMGWMKASSEGDYVPFWSQTISRLGAPYSADWNDYPMYEKILTFCLGTLARFTGVFTATNIAVLLGHLSSALSFYACARFLKHPRIWSFVGAVLFSWTYYHFFRGLGHLLLAYSYILPWAMLSCWVVVASKCMRLGDKLSWMCLITALWMGLSNPYNLNVYCQLLIFSLLVQFFGRRRMENIKVCLIMLGLAVAGFLAINMGSLAYQWAHGKNPSAIDRHYFECELYSLKLMELFIPPQAHSVEGMAMLGKRYASEAYVHGEMFSPYLGIIGIAGLVWIFATTFLLLVRGWNGRKNFPPHAVQTVWILIYSILGGLNCILALGGIQYFRSSNRYSIFISTIVLLFLVAKISKWSRRVSPGIRYLVAAVVLLIALVDQLPAPPAKAETEINARIVEEDQKFGRLLEEKLPPHSMVFQMPVMVFPDSVPANNVSGYEMLRPYFVTKTLRFSFGSVRGRNREAWQWEMEQLPPAEMAEELEKYGFSAIYINRKGYADQGKKLISQLVASGREVICFDSSKEQVCIGLHPSAKPELPHTDERAEFLLKDGWTMQESNPLENREWTTGNASFSFFSVPKGKSTYRLQCELGTIEDRGVSMVMDGQKIWSGELQAGKNLPVEISLTAGHGNNTIRLYTDAPPSHPKESKLPLAFTVLNLRITRTWTAN